VSKQRRVGGLKPENTGLRNVYRKRENDRARGENKRESQRQERDLPEVGASIKGVSTESKGSCGLGNRASGVGEFTLPIVGVVKGISEHRENRNEKSAAQVERALNQLVGEKRVMTL